MSPSEEEEECSRESSQDEGEFLKGGSAQRQLRPHRFTSIMPTQITQPAPFL